ncbi:MAG: T9SS type A sorting domain-containing protein [Bacteroidota bacterium]
MAALLFCLLFSLNSIFAQGKGPDDPPPPGSTPTYDTVRIVKTNWQNTMGCTYDTLPCLQLVEDNKIVFAAKARMGVNDITPYPTARVQYYVLVEVPGGTSTVAGMLSGPITNSSLSPVTLENGASAYQATVGIEVDVSDACLQSNEFTVKIGYMLVETIEINGYVAVIGPYPVGDHPTLFPPGIFIVDPSGEAQEYEKRKQVCCFDPNKPLDCPSGGNGGGDTGGGAGGAGGRSSGTDDGGVHAVDLGNAGVAVFPNPTRSTMQAQYTMKAAGEMTIHCMDAQGRLISQHRRQHATEGQYQLPIATENWTPGVYYLRFETAGTTKTLKVVKLNE